jgi:hypothetical protein
MEFVQVKSNEHDQLWSVSLLCQREKATASTGIGTSILERSLANDRGCEPCKFRIVTCRPVHTELKVLTYDRNGEYRKLTSEGISAIQALLEEISKKITQFQSPNENACDFWLERAFW